MVRQIDPFLLFPVHRHAFFFRVVGRAVVANALVGQGFRLHPAFIQIGNVQTRQCLAVGMHQHHGITQGMLMHRAVVGMSEELQPRHIQSADVYHILCRKCRHVAPHYIVQRDAVEVADAVHFVGVGAAAVVALPAPFGNRGVSVFIVRLCAAHVQLVARSRHRCAVSGLLPAIQFRAIQSGRGSRQVHRVVVCFVIAAAAHDIHAGVIGSAA